MLKTAHTSFNGLIPLSSAKYFYARSSSAAFLQSCKLLGRLSTRRGLSAWAGESKGSSDMAPPVSAVLPDGARVLSIQSHTVQGYVGNKAATFPLQLHGFDVDPVNSVQFSNHTGYPTVKGQVLDGEQLWALVEGLEANDLLQYTHLLTGYIGSLSFLTTVLKVLEKLRSVNPNLIYVCDPVMGDDGKFYVKEELVPVYREKVVQAASLLTPNRFEAEQLVGFKIGALEDAARACDVLHKAGPSTVVITSMELDGQLYVIGSQAQQKEGKPVRYQLVIPKLPHYFTGTGDLMTALLLAWTHQYPNDLAKALELSVASLQAVLQRTVKDYREAGVEPATRNKQLEIRLIQSQRDLIAPIVTTRAELMHC